MESKNFEVKKLLLFYKIVNKEAPDYLYELVPPLVAANVNYNLRNSHKRKLNTHQNNHLYGKIGFFFSGFQH
jgi:hypothetical protein